jgi:hypothetical protein
VFALAVAVFHRTWAWPSTTQVGAAGDADEYTWFLSWVPFAIGHGLDPLVSHYVAHPGGVNLMWNTSVLLPSFVLAPITVVFGSAFSYNVLVTGAPALGAAFAYMAFRRWTGRLPSLVGALIFAFSPYMASQSVGHPAQILLFSAPLMLVLADRVLVLQQGRAWLDGVLLGLVAWAQLLTGEEVLAMEAITAAVALVVLAAMARAEVPSRSRYAKRALAWAAGVFVVVSAPFLAVQYLGPYRVQNVHPANIYTTDLLNFFVPTRVTQFAPEVALRISHQFRGDGSEHGAYIGVPLALFAVLALILARRRLVTWAAFAIGLVAAVLSMGPTLRVLGHNTHLPLPGYVLQHVPLARNLLPDRFASMMTFGLALLVALGLDELRRSPTRTAGPAWALAGVGLAAILPTVHYPSSASPELGGYEAGWVCPAASSSVSAQRPAVALTVPADNELDLRWQAMAGFCFVMPTDTGMTGTNGGFAKGNNVLFKLGDPAVPLPALNAATRSQAAMEIREYGIKEVIVTPQSPAVPNWSWADQGAVAKWLAELLGEAPEQTPEVYHSYVWKSLPSISSIASGNFGPGR